MLRAAVEQFIDKDRKDIEGVAMETLEGHQRAMMGAMTVDEIFKDRIKFSTQAIANTCVLNFMPSLKISSTVIAPIMAL